MVLDVEISREYLDEDLTQRPDVTPSVQGPPVDDVRMTLDQLLQHRSGAVHVRVQEAGQLVIDHCLENSLLVPLEEFCPLIGLDISYAEGSTGNTASWIAFDNYLSHYRVTINGVIVVEDAFADVNEDTATVDIDGLAYGDHPVIITVWDIEDNTAILS